MERSSKTYNGDLCIFRETLFTVYSPSQPLLPVTVTRFLVERATMGKAGGQGNNVVTLFRQQVQQHALNLTSQFQCSLRQPMQVVMDTRLN